MINEQDAVQVLTNKQEKLLEVMASHAALQHQFMQLTQHVEACYARIQKLELFADVIRNRLDD